MKKKSVTATAEEVSQYRIGKFSALWDGRRKQDSEK